MISRTKYKTDNATIEKLFVNAGITGVTRIAPLGAGEYNAVYSVTAKGKEYALKISPADDDHVLTYENKMMLSEVFWYQQIQEHTDIAVPKIFYTDFDQTLIPADYFIMEKLPGEQMDKMEFSNALAEIWMLIRRSNKYIDETMPWVLAKDPEKKERLGTVLYHLAESLRFVSVLISPVMTQAPALIRSQLGLNEDEAYAGWESLASFGAIPAGTKAGQAEPLFPRMDVEEELTELESLIPGGGKEQKAEPDIEKKPEITFDEFTKVQLRVASVTTAEKVAKSNKLLKLSLSLGDETRQVVSGIAKYYSADEMVGKQVVLVANLKPAKLMGIVSQGMILCAEDDEGNLKLISPEGAIPDGAEIS